MRSDATPIKHVFTSAKGASEENFRDFGLKSAENVPFATRLIEHFSVFWACVTLDFQLRYTYPPVTRDGLYERPILRHNVREKARVLHSHPSHNYCRAGTRYNILWSSHTFLARMHISDAARRSMKFSRMPRGRE